MEIIRNTFRNFNRPKEHQITLGKIKGSLFKEETLTESQLNHHVHIVGASGFGKTVLISHIVKDRIFNNRGMFYVDLKGDIETIEKYKSWCQQAGRENDLFVFSISDFKNSCSYNLILNGTATQIKDKIMLSLNWSEEFYKNQASSFLLKLLIGLCHLRDNLRIHLSLGLILDCITDLEILEKMVHEVHNSELKIKRQLEDCYDFLKSNDNFKSLQGLRAQLESLVLSDFGELLKENGASINLFKAYKEKKIIMIFLDSRRYGESARAVGKFILQDLKMLSSRVDAELPVESRHPFSVIIDEFADLAQEDFVGFLDRARSSKIQIVMSHQEICDLLRISQEFAGRIMGNSATLYAFLQKRPESAELISSMAGTKKVWKETLRSEKMLFFDFATGDKSLREVEEFNIHPNVVKNLGVGTCVVVKKYPKATSDVVKVFHEVK